MTNTAASSSLTLNGLRLLVFIGVHPEEMQKKQEVSLNLRICFAEPPQACVTDQLDDTYCYDSIIAYLKEQLTPKKFRLVEYLAQESYQALKSYFPQTMRTAIGVQVTKMPAIAGLSAGVTFEYGDQSFSSLSAPLPRRASSCLSSA
jgi:FolB domain-containing protein